MLTQQKFPAGEIPLLEVNRGEKEEGLSPCLPGSERFHFESPPDGRAERHPCFIVARYLCMTISPSADVATGCHAAQNFANFTWFHPTRSAGMKTQQRNDSCLCKCHIIYLSIHFSQSIASREYMSFKIISRKVENAISPCALFESISKYQFSPLNIIYFHFRAAWLHTLKHMPRHIRK